MIQAYETPKPLFLQAACFAAKLTLFETTFMPPMAVLLSVLDISGNVALANVIEFALGFVIVTS